MKHIIIIEMSLCNVLQRAGSDFCVNDNSPGTFVDFRFKIFTQELAAPMFMSVKYSTVRCLLNAVVKVPRNCCERF